MSLDAYPSHMGGSILVSVTGTDNPVSSQASAPEAEKQKHHANAADTASHTTDTSDPDATAPDPRKEHGVVR